MDYLISCLLGPICICTNKCNKCLIMVILYISSLNAYQVWGFIIMDIMVLIRYHVRSPFRKDISIFHVSYLLILHVLVKELLIFILLVDTVEIRLMNVMEARFHLLIVNYTTTFLLVLSLVILCISHLSMFNHKSLVHLFMIFFTIETKIMLT